MLAVMWSDLAWLGLFRPNACVACQEPLFQMCRAAAVHCSQVAQARPAQSAPNLQMQELHVDSRLD